MILLRLFVFFCGSAPYSAAHAKGMALAAAMQVFAVLPLLYLRHLQRVTPAVRCVLRVYAAFFAARLTVFLLTLCAQLQLQTAAAAVLLALTLLYTVSLHDRASARTATLLLCAAALGFLLLPVSGIGTARRILLHIPDSAAAAFLREFSLAGELPLLLLIRQKQTEQSAKRSTVSWALFRCIGLPVLVLFGAMQNGRLLQFAGNPFFLLLARTPLSEAVRTDGLWLLLAFASGALSITFCLQTAKLHRRGKLPELLTALLPYAFFLALLALLPQMELFTGILNVLLGILLPWGIVLLEFLSRRREPA